MGDRCAGIRRGSSSGARLTNHAPSGNRSASARAASIARLVLPMPPGPVSVTSRASSSSRTRSARSRSRPRNEVSRSGRLPDRRGDGPERREVRRQTRDVELLEALGARDVAQDVAAQIAQGGPVGQGIGDEGGGGLGQQDLAAVAGRRDACRTVHVEAAVVIAGQVRLAGVESHPDPDRRRPAAMARRPAHAAHRPPHRPRRSPRGRPRRPRRPRCGRRCRRRPRPRAEITATWRALISSQRGPRLRTSRIDPSTSVRRNVTVPTGSVPVPAESDAPTVTGGSTARRASRASPSPRRVARAGSP